jgi:hypothetical protein
MTGRDGITLDTALATARRMLASVAERAAQRGSYSGARTEIINAHADMRAALDLLIMAAGDDGRGAAKTSERDGGRQLAGTIRDTGPPSRPTLAVVNELSEGELDALIGEATVDCYNEHEELGGFAVTIGDILAMPFETTVLGVT